MPVRKAIVPLLFAVLVPPLLAASPAPEYRLTKTVNLGTPERWDYVVYDRDSHRVYVAHGDHVSVIDGHSGAVLGEIGPFPGGTHGTATVTSLGRGYTDDGKAGIVGSFDLKTLAVLKYIPAEPDADSILFDPVSGRVFVINGDSRHVSVIDPKSDTVIATIDGEEALETGAVDGHGKLFVNGVGNGDIIAIDTASNKVIAHYPMPGCERPHGLAVDGERERLFSSCANGVLVVLDGSTGADLATLPIGKYTDSAAFDPKRKLAFSSNGDGTVTIIRESEPQTFVVAGTLQTAPGARTMALDPETGRLFLATADVASVDPATTPGKRPHVNYVPGSLKLMFFDPR